MEFQPKSIKSFRFVSHNFDESAKTAKFHYAFDDAVHFVEELVFPGAKLPLEPHRKAALNTCLHHLHLALGISYYKAAIPEKIVIENHPISEEMADFWEKLYLNGLGEFAYRNQLDLRGKIRFPYGKKTAPAPSNIRLGRQTAVPLGGGKDSLVTVDVLDAIDTDIRLFSLGDFEAIKAAAQATRHPLITVRRRLSPFLFEINARGALNGHVPISAIIAFTLSAAAILYDFDTAILSNERSANSGNLVHRGFSVNHQYSKSLEFERDISNYFNRNVLENFTYFSLMRPLSDLHIAKLFARLRKYHSVFTSCNSAFRIFNKKNTGRWCLDCPKCRFTFLALAPFVEKSALISIFGKNLLDDPSHAGGFDALLGIGAHRPFECVGEPRESTAAFLLVSDHPDWRNDDLVRRFKTHIRPGVNHPERLVRQSLDYSGDHLLPEYYDGVLRAYSGA